MDKKDILTLSHITKIYPGVVALNDVSVSFREGEVHALCGENGAGKSTLMKVLAGAITPESGTIELDGEFYPSMTPKLSREKGVEVIYQEYNLIDSLSAAENICLGDRKSGLVDFRAMEKTAQDIFDRFHIDIDPKAEVGTLTNARKQIVEIAKAVSKNVRILVMDEPTAPLTVAEVDILMNIVADLKKKGVTIIYMQLMGLGIYPQYIVKGIVLCAAVGFDSYQRFFRKETKRVRKEPVPASDDSSEA